MADEANAEEVPDGTEEIRVNLDPRRREIASALREALKLGQIHEHQSVGSRFRAALKAQVIVVCRIYSRAFGGWAVGYAFCSPSDTYLLAEGERRARERAIEAIGRCMGRNKFCEFLERHAALWKAKEKPAAPVAVPESKAQPGDLICGVCGKNLSDLARQLGTNAAWLESHHRVAAHVWPAVVAMERETRQLVALVKSFDRAPTADGLALVRAKADECAESIRALERSAPPKHVAEARDPAPAGGTV